MPSAHHSTLAIDARGLCKRFKPGWRSRPVTAVEGISLQIQCGEIYALIGPNGSGKSTLMKLILGLARPTAGNTHIFGHAAGSMEAKKLIGFLPESPYFAPFLTGRELISYHGKLCGLWGGGLKTRVDELLNLVDLSAAANRSLRTYSKGMLQRVGLAQALVGDPSLLLLDEPTAGVDPIGCRQIQGLLTQLRSQGKTIVFSSHLLDHVQEIADRVMLLHQGRTLSEGKLDQLLQTPEDMQLLCKGLHPENQLALLRFLKEMPGVETSIQPAHQTLDDFFIRKIESR